MDKWDARFMELAKVIASWASCYKPNRKIGAVIVKNKRIVTTGYNGAPAGIKTCVERGECLREKLGIQSGTHHEICYAVHAEQNAIIQAARLGSSIIKQYFFKALRLRYSQLEFQFQSHVDASFLSYCSLFFHK